MYVCVYVCMYVISFHSKGIVVTFSRFCDNLCLKTWRGAPKLSPQ